jgi:hypothetical protein
MQEIGNLDPYPVEKLFLQNYFGGTVEIVLHRHRNKSAFIVSSRKTALAIP